MKPREEFKVMLLLSNGHYHPNDAPQINFPLGPARLAANLKKAGYITYILDSQAEGLLQVVLREQTRYLGRLVGKVPELKLHSKNNLETVEVGLPDDQLLERIKSFQPDIILASLMFSVQAGILIRQIEIIRAQTKIPVLVGGVAASMYPDVMGKHRDLVFRGKFDDYIVDLVDAYRMGQGVEEFNRYKVKFAELKHNGTTVNLEPMVPALFPSYQIPVGVYERAEQFFREELTVLGGRGFDERYPYVIQGGGNSFYIKGPIYAILLFTHSVKNTLNGFIAHVLMREGCVFTCEGCHISVETRLGNPLGILCRKIDDVVDELTYLHRNGYRKIILADDQSFLPKNYLPELARKILSLGLEFYLPNAVLVNAIAKLDIETLCNLIKAGFRSYTLAVETGRQEIMDQYWDKKLPSIVQTTVKACKKLREASSIIGIPIHVETNFVIGHAGMTQKRETPEQIYDSVFLGRYLIDEGLSNYAVFSLYVPAPGTISYDNLIRWGMIQDQYAMSFGLYAIDGEELFSPRSFEALHVAGWLFANRKKVTGGRSCFNLEPEVDTDPHAHIDKGYLNHHLQRLDAGYEKYVEQIKAS